MLTFLYQHLQLSPTRNNSTSLCTPRLGPNGVDLPMTNAEKARAMGGGASSGPIQSAITERAPKEQRLPMGAFARRSRGGCFPSFPSLRSLRSLRGLRSAVGCTRGGCLRGVGLYGNWSRCFKFRFGDWCRWLKTRCRIPRCTALRWTPQGFRG